MRRGGLRFTHRPLSSSFLGLPYRILNINHKKELFGGLWVGFREFRVYCSQASQGCGFKAVGLRHFGV